jgi:ribosomal protein S18 acetylase RimI-like enzyme
MRAGPGDAEWAASLMAASEPWITLGTTAEKFLTTLTNPEYQVFVARSNGVASGLVVLHPRGLASSPYIKSIAVSEGQRGQGIGRTLMDFAENHFRQDSKHLFLCVSSFNKRAIDFYSRLGYGVVGELKDYILTGESEIIMHKKLR